MEGIELIGTPYLTQTELKEDELRELYSKVYTASESKFRQATENEISEVQARKELEQQELEIYE